MKQLRHAPPGAALFGTSGAAAGTVHRNDFQAVVGAEWWINDGVALTLDQAPADAERRFLGKGEVFSTP